jgi:cytidylate kinase
MSRTVIAIDGPAGSGKSTVARRLAERIGYRFLDSGAMYRALALLALEKGVPEDGWGKLLEESEFLLDGARVFLNGRDVSGEIRTTAVTSFVSRVAAVPEVRTGMVEKQRHVYPDENMVVEGRDIGSVVFPDADLKVYLTASAEERAKRRALESGRDEGEVLTEQNERDEQDRSREHSPLIRAEGAVEVDTTGLSIDEVVTRLAALLEERPTG